MKGRKGISTRALIAGVAVAAAAVVAAAMLLRADPTGRKGHGLPKEYIYDLTELRKIDPKLILFQAVQQFHAGFQDAQAIAVGRDGRIYLAGDKAIRILPAQATQTGPDSEQIKTVPTAGTPLCLAVDEDGTIYAGVGDHMEVYDPAGKLKASWPAPTAGALLTSIAIAEEDVFAADAANRVVLRYTKSGELIGRIGERDTKRNIPGLVVPSPYLDLAVAKDGLLRVVNPGMFRVEAYTPGGDLELWWGQGSAETSGFTGCCNPVSFALLPDGGFVTCEKGIRRVKLYDADGRFVGVVAGPDSFATDPATPRTGRRRIAELDVAVDAHGRVLVLDPYTGDVKVFVRKAKAK